MNNIAACLGALLILLSGFADALLEKDNVSESDSILEAAHHFIHLLDSSEKKNALFKLDDPDRLKWHYFPDMIERKGLRLKDLTQNKQKAIFNILKLSLSKNGFKKLKRVLALENTLFEKSGWSVRDPKKYYFTLFGNPQINNHWAFQFEGHHISLNYVFKGNTIIATAPRFFGANPSVHHNQKDKRINTLKKEEDYARKLVQSLNSKQKGEAIIHSVAPTDIMTRHNSLAEPITPKGLSINEMSARQREIFISLIRVYLDILPEKTVLAQQLQILTYEINHLFFAWAGSVKEGQGHYYRIQGKTFLIEYNNTQDEANHIHTVWRDLHNDFGGKVLKLDSHEY